MRHQARTVLLATCLVCVACMAFCHGYAIDDHHGDENAYGMRTVRAPFETQPDPPHIMTCEPLSDRAACVSRCGCGWCPSNKRCYTMSLHEAHCEVDIETGDDWPCNKTELAWAIVAATVTIVLLVVGSAVLFWFCSGGRCHCPHYLCCRRWRTRDDHRYSPLIIIGTDGESDTVRVDVNPERDADQEMPDPLASNPASPTAPPKWHENGYVVLATTPY